MPVLVNEAALRFVHPEAFLLLWLLLPLLAAWLLAGRARRRAAQRFRATGAATDAARSLRPLLAGLTLLGYAALVVAVARPGWESQTTTLERHGRDVVFVVDVSPQHAGSGPGPQSPGTRQGSPFWIPSNSSRATGWHWWRSPAVPW